MPYTYPKGTKVYFCEHEEKNKEADPNHASFISIYAGETVRFEICRLCSTMALGVITSSRIQDRFDEWMVNNPNWVLKE